MQRDSGLRIAAASHHVAKGRKGDKGSEASFRFLWFLWFLWPIKRSGTLLSFNLPPISSGSYAIARSEEPFD